MLIERIAEAPEIRAAIAAQGAGLVTDIGVKLTRLTEALDDALERIVRDHEPDSETNQAGLATRLGVVVIHLGGRVRVREHAVAGRRDHPRRDRLPARRSGPGPVLVSRWPDAGDALFVDPADAGRLARRDPRPRDQAPVCARRRAAPARAGLFLDPARPLPPRLARHDDPDRGRVRRRPTGSIRGSRRRYGARLLWKASSSPQRVTAK